MIKSQRISLKKRYLEKLLHVEIIIRLQHVINETIEGSEDTHTSDLMRFPRLRRRYLQRTLFNVQSYYFSSHCFFSFGNIPKSQLYSNRSKRFPFYSPTIRNHLTLTQMDQIDYLEKGISILFYKD